MNGLIVLLAKWIESFGHSDFEIKQSWNENPSCRNMKSHLEEDHNPDHLDLVKHRNIWTIGLAKAVEQILEDQSNAA